MTQQNAPSILAAGGDLRQIHLCRLLGASHTLFTVGFDPDHPLYPDHAQPLLAPMLADLILLPVPVTLDGIHINAPFSNHAVTIDSVLRMADAHTLVLGGKIEAPLRAMLDSRAIPYADYMEREELAILNAVATAQGAIGIAIQELPVTLYGTNCLLLGYGRVSRALARVLCGFGAHVTIAARKLSDLTWAKVNGCDAIALDQLATCIPDQTLLINTIPAMILNEELLALISKHALVIDLASKPGGVDFCIAKELGIRVIWALSLPGKATPITAGAIIADTVRHIAAERGLSLD